MRYHEFRRWLVRTRAQQANTAASRAANCRTVERAYNIDLDLPNESAFAALLDEFIYSVQEQRGGRPVQHRVKISGDEYNGTATLRSALRLYRDFRLRPGAAAG